MMLAELRGDFEEGKEELPQLKANLDRMKLERGVPTYDEVHQSMYDSLSKVSPKKWGCPGRC